MNLQELVEAFRQEAHSQAVSTVFWAKGLQASPLCSYLFVERLSRFTNKKIKHFSCAQLSVGDIQAQLAMSFLGETMLYWVKDTDELLASDRKRVEALISTYKGPHTLVYMSDAKPSKEVQVLTFEEKIGAATYPALYELIHGAAYSQSDFSKKLFQKCKSIHLDTACMLTYYQSMLGRQSEQFLEVWLERIVLQEHSLFELSKAFFAKDDASFFKVWQHVFESYPPEFWIVYWSDQLWQALSFIVAQKQKVTPPPHRLPFWFVQQGWKKYRATELVKAHSFIYSFDYAFKHGALASTAGMELFCLKFLTGGFSC